MPALPDPVLTFVVPSHEAGQRLDVFLAAQTSLHSRSQLTRRIEQHEVTVDGQPAKPGLRLRLGQVVCFAPPPLRDAADQPQAIPLDILHEDPHLLVVNKPAGMVVHPAPGHPSGTLVNALLYHCGSLPSPPAYHPPKHPADDPEGADPVDDEPSDGAVGLSIGGERRPGIVHRLDQGTSGLLVCAKDEPTLTGLQVQFSAHTIARRYIALVEGVLPAEGTFSTRYGRHPRDRKRFTARSGGKHAITHYRVLERLPGATLVEARLETGRTHQIRVHFSEAGHPLLGDPVYGRLPRLPLLRTATACLGPARQALHARLLGFVHPILGNTLSFTAPLPADFEQALLTLRQPVAVQTLGRS